MKKSVIFLFVASAIAMAGCSGKQDAKKDEPQQNSAKIVFSVGDVKVENAGAVADAKPDMVIGSGMTVVTGKKSQCNMLIGESSYVSVKENSKLIIESLIKKTNGTEDSSIDLASGRLVVNPKKLLKDESFRVKTPTAVAAVRGTKFVVANEPGQDVSISVVEGMVEMKPRVAALEELSAETNGSAEAAAEIQKKIDAAAVVIEANQSASIDTKVAEELNTSVETAIQEIKESAAKESNEANKKGDTGDVVNTAKVDVPVALIESLTKKIEKVEIEKVQKVEVKAVEEVKALDEAVKEDVKKREEAAKPSAFLTVTTPIKNSVIKIDGKAVGYGTATVKVDPEKAVTIDITARDFEAYKTEVTLTRDEKKTVEIPLVKSKLKDRVEWSNALAGGVKGDVIFYNSMIITATANGSVAAMDKNGAVLWRTSLGGGIDSAPAIADGRLYAVTKNETIHALNASDGKVLWSNKISGSLVFGSAPMITDGNIVVATSVGKVYFFGSDGKQKWMKDLQCGIFSSPAKNGNLIYIGADDRMLYALNIKKGSVEWRTKLDGRVVSSSPVVYDGKIFIGTYKGTIYSLAANRGTIAWMVKTGGPVISSPVCYKDRVYVGSKDSKLYSIAMESGRVEWTLVTERPVTTEVSIQGNELYAAGGRTVYSVDAATGRVNWAYGLNENAVSLIADGNGVYVGTGGNLVSLRIDLKDVVR